jgi:hypothetical protein
VRPRRSGGVGRSQRLAYPDAVRAFAPGSPPWRRPWFSSGAEQCTESCSTDPRRRVHAGTILHVSEHTERIEDLTRRVASAKEFL